MPIYIMGKRYDVPDGMTIMKAMEWAGYRLLRGCGCRAGFCGACATVYRLKGDHKLYFGLACQTVVQPEMILTQIPFFPAPRAVYDLAAAPTRRASSSARPIRRFCAAWPAARAPRPARRTWTSWTIWPRRCAATLPRVRRKSFDCIMCGLCAARCPVGEVQYNVAILARRLYGKYLAPRSAHLDERIAEIEAGAFDARAGRAEGADTLTSSRAALCRARYRGMTCAQRLMVSTMPRGTAMTYPPDMQASLEKVVASRQRRLHGALPQPAPDEKQALLRTLPP